MDSKLKKFNPLKRLSTWQAAITLRELCSLLSECIYVVHVILRINASIIFFKHINRFDFEIEILCVFCKVETEFLSVCL
jgi:hypothetical protein